MSNPNEVGITVTGVVTGTHVIEDIGVAVPHGVAVPITPEQMLRSKDLWRGINRGKLFKLDCGAFRVPPNKRSEQDKSTIARLTKENKSLRQQVEELERKNDGLQRALMGMNTHLDGILASLGRLESTPATAVPALDGAVDNEEVMALLRKIAASGNGAAAAASAALNDVVGIDAPVFIPEEIKPKGAETSIRVQKSTSEGSSVTDASKKLKELRRKAGE